MKIEQQIENYFTAEQRLSNGKVLIAEGETRQEASKACIEMISESQSPLVQAESEMLTFNEEDFQRIFGK